MVDITFCHGQIQTVAFWIRCRFIPSGQGQDAGGFRQLSILVGQQNGHHRFTVIPWPDKYLQCHKFRFHRLPVAWHPVELIQQPVTGAGTGTDGMRRHVEDIPQPAQLILERLFQAVFFSLSDTVLPDSGCQSDREPEPDFLCHRTRIDQHAILDGLGTGVAVYHITEKGFGGCIV